MSDVTVLWLLLPAPYLVKLLLRRLTALVASTGILSCGAAADLQTLTLPDVGELRLRHAHVLTATDAKDATATAEILVRWTREQAWDPLRVKVNGSHPLVTELKAGPVLVLAPADASLPLIWVSLVPGLDRTLLENRLNGSLALYNRPPGQSLNLGWLKP